MTAPDPFSRPVEPFPFTSRDFVAETFPTLRAAWLLGGADQPTFEDWLRQLAATPEGLEELFDIIRAIKAVSRRFTDIADMLDTISERIDETLVTIGTVKPVA